MGVSLKKPSLKVELQAVTKKLTLDAPPLNRVEQDILVDYYPREVVKVRRVMFSKTNVYVMFTVVGEGIDIFGMIGNRFVETWYRRDKGMAFVERVEKKAFEPWE